MSSQLLLFIFLSPVFGTENDVILPNNDLPILPKCCPLNESFGEDNKKCVPSDLEFVPVFSGTEPPEEVNLLEGLKCPHGRYRLEPDLELEDKFVVLANGSLFVPYHTPQIFNYNEYCLESFRTETDSVQVLALLCFPAPPDPSWKEVSMIIYSVGCLISVPFLLITFLVYTTSAELRDIMGKVLSCHIACLAVAYASLSLVQLTGSVLSIGLCKVVAYIIQFSFLSSFFWLNVLCFQTWRRLRSKLHQKQKKHKRPYEKTFLIYNIYAWGCPLVFFVVTLAMDNPSVPSSYLKPNFGVNSCWFNDEMTALPYFYGPVALILVANLALFILSAVHVWNNNKFTREPMKKARLDVADIAIQVIKQRRKQKFIECILLFLVMGLNWVWEVVSWSVGGPPQMWLVTDLFNTLQGVIVFYVFVVRDPCAKNVLMHRISFCCSNNRQRHNYQPTSSV